MPVGGPLPGLLIEIDKTGRDAAVCGETLMHSRGMLESDYLAAVLAHELGHMDTSDGKLTAAISRRIINPLPRPNRRRPDQPEPPTQMPTVIMTSEESRLAMTFFGAMLWLIRRVLRFARGGFVQKVLAPFWGSYWRGRECTADRFAASLGQAKELADFHALIDDHPVPSIWMTEQTHPPTELRVDKLRNTGPIVDLVATGSEPVKAAPMGPLAAGPAGPAVTEPDPSAGRAIRSAGRALPTFGGQDQ